jgi:hypothetical protein
VVGDHVPLRSTEGVLRYKRAWGDQDVLIALNITCEPRLVECEAAGTLLLSTYLDKDEVQVKNQVVLRPDEGVIIKFQYS